MVVEGSCVRGSDNRCRRSKSNHRCCFNSRFRNKQTRHASDSVSSNSSANSSGSKRRRSSSSDKTSSGYGCSDPKRLRYQSNHKRRRRSSHVTHKSNLTVGTSKTVRLPGDQVRSRESSKHSCRSGLDRSCANLSSNTNHSPLVNRRPSRSGYHSRGPSPNGHLRNVHHITPPKRSERVDVGRSRRERREQKRRDERAQRKLSHEGHKRKPSPVVAVGDVVKRRYRVQKSIGEGSFGQVFECFDLCTNSLTAVKVLKPQDDYKDVAKHELNVLERVSRLDTKSRSHCIVSLDFFDWHGHFFLVSPLLGPSVFSFLEQNNYEPYPAEHSAVITRQLCEAVDFLHRIGITHTDLKPENILFVDGSFDEIYNDNRRRYIRRIRNPSIKVIDFGSACFDGEHHSTTIQTRHYRAPEVVMELGWDHTSDVWSVGCIVFELVTGECLFMTHDNLEHLAMMERVLGPIPKSMIRASRRRRYFRHGRLDWSAESSDARYVRKILKPLGDYWFSNSDMHIRLAFDLAREMLVYVPSNRITCSKALEHPFLLSFEN
ncbi:hypothetical protein P879_07643 [Paragonimus westermani]|uniref:Protein kinase domain-containing protein n=1 Tax=Paragonimus westermani TaxID=34504 RepID=A0A8T0D4R1_9TREM|nr:hypothetical protein P879_07643 [Paragonimus westermani]